MREIRTHFKSFSTMYISTKILMQILAMFKYYTYYYQNNYFKNRKLDFCHLPH